MHHNKIYSHQVGYTRLKAAHRPSVIFEPHIVDAWRQTRYYETLRPLVACYANASWLTVGDTGADAYWLKSAGVKDLTCSSLDLGQILHLQDQGLLDGIDIKAINAEEIDLPDGAFDFVCCKEAYHHFPRAPLGFYEMLRVARVAVALVTEPNCPPQNKPLDQVRRAIKRLLRRNTELSDPDFEASGNFIFGPSVHEIKKMATGLQLHSIYYSYISDFYLEKLSKAEQSDWRSMLMMKIAIRTQDLFSHLKIMNWAKVTFVIFKSEPPAAVHRALMASGKKHIKVPVNPYV